MPKLKEAHKSEISINLLAFGGKKNFEELGKMVYEELMRPESQRLVWCGDKYIVVKECVVHGS